MVRPRRMVESLEDRGQESFFCGPPGKLQPGQFLALMWFSSPHLLELEGPGEQIWADSGRRLASHIQTKEVRVITGRMRQVSVAPARKGQAGRGCGTGRDAGPASGQPGTGLQAPENLSFLWPRVSIFPLVGPGSGAKALSSGPCVAEKSYAQLVFMSTSAGSLWNCTIHSMCRMEHDQVSWLRCAGAWWGWGELGTPGT